MTFLHADVQGSPLLATDEQGQVLWQEEYEPWGARQVKEAAAETASRGSEVWYTGQEEEAGLGMYYHGARWYMPHVGQFTGMDPVGIVRENARSFNRFAYANNNPIRYADPDGRVPVIVVAILAYNLLTFTDYANAPGPSDQLHKANGAEPFVNSVPTSRLVKGVGGVVQVVSEASRKRSGAGKANKENDRGGPPRDEDTGNYLPHPDAEGPHSTLGTREGRSGSYTQGATFDKDKQFRGRTDVTNHNRGDHESPHWHPATGPNSVEKGSHPLPDFSNDPGFAQ